MQAEIGGKLYFAGNEKFAGEKGLATETQARDMERLAEEGKTPLLFFDEKEILGIIAAADVVIPSLDGGDAALLDKVNRPAASLDFDRIVEG